MNWKKLSLWLSIFTQIIRWVLDLWSLLFLFYWVPNEKNYSLKLFEWIIVCGFGGYVYLRIYGQMGKIFNLKVNSVATKIARPYNLTFLLFIHIYILALVGLMLVLYNGGW
jgi:hypothetical protein